MQNRSGAIWKTVNPRTRSDSFCPPGIEMELLEEPGSRGFVVPLDSPYVEASARAIEHAFGRAHESLGSALSVVEQDLYPQHQWHGHLGGRRLTQRPWRR